MASQDARKAIDEMVRRIVAGFDPDQGILFGSFARGDAGPGSDVDLAVILPGVEGSRLKKTVDIRMAIGGLGVSKDVVVLTSRDLEEQQALVGTLGHILKREGKVLYHRA